MKEYKRITLMVLSLLFLLALTIVIAQRFLNVPSEVPTPPGPFPPHYLRDILDTYILSKTIITTANLTLLLVVLITYIRIYHSTRSKFSLGLIFLTIALILYAITSNPIIQLLTGFRGSGLGPFTMLPDFFTLIASAILLYLSRQ